MQQTPLIYVVLAGGRGARLWPLSRSVRPKQLIAIQGSTLLDYTLRRLSANHHDERWVVTTAAYSADVRTHLAQQPDMAAVRVIEELEGRNTAAAIALATIQALKQGNPLLVICPADHVIDNNADYAAVIQEARACALATNSLVLIGVQPTHPSPLYGYMTTAVTDNASWFFVKEFHEKPPRERAHALVQQPGVFWNCGIFVASAQTLFELFMTHAPDLYQAVEQQDYARCPAISFDKLIVEKAALIHAIKGNFSWADIGSLELFAEHVKATTGARLTDIMEIDSNGCSVIAGKKLVVVSGIDDIIIVDTDDVLLVMKKDNTARIERVMGTLSRAGYQKYL